MNKNKIIMISIAAVALLAVIGLGAMAYVGWEEKVELEDDLDTAKNNVERISRAEIKPEQASIDAIKANTKALLEWREATYQAVSQGDVAEDVSVTPESFKQTMVDDARALSGLPGVADAKIVGEGFDFGFRNYILEGAMPEKDNLKALQRQWREVSAFVKALSEAGANQLLSVEVKPAQTVQAEEPQQKPKKKGARKAKNADKPDPTVRQSYTLVFLARPASFTRFLNALAFDERFTVVDDFTISRQDDTIGKLLGGAKTDASAGGGRRGRRRGRRAEDVSEDAEDEGANSKGLVTDPLREPPFTVTMAITTYDFGSKNAETETKEDGE